MKQKMIFRTVIAMALLFGIAIAFFTTIMNGQYGNASLEIITEDSSMNLWIEGIDGESKVAGRENSIDILAYSHSIRNAYNPDRSAGQIVHTPIRIVKYIDKATPKLFEHCTKGTVIGGTPAITLRFYSNPTPMELNYLTIELTNAVVVSVSTYIGSDSNDIPMETVSFIYETIKWTYTEFNAMGNPVGNVEYTATWGGTPI